MAERTSISGIVITLTTNPALSDGTRHALQEHRHDPLLSLLRSTRSLEIGEVQLPRIPAVVEASSHHESQSIHSWIESLPGVEKVDVVFAAFDDELPAEENEESDAAG